MGRSHFAGWALRAGGTIAAAYGFSAKADLLAQILTLNQSVAAAISSGDPVTAPGIPPGFPDPTSLVTEDCISPK